MTPEARAIRLLGRRWFDRGDAAAYLGISVTTFDREIRPGLTPHLIGRRAKFDRLAIDKIMEAKAVDVDISIPDVVGQED